jgi:hypothetical protein
MAAPAGAVSWCSAAGGLLCWEQPGLSCSPPSAGMSVSPVAVARATQEEGQAARLVAMFDNIRFRVRTTVQPTPVLVDGNPAYQALSW